MNRAESLLKLSEEIWQNADPEISSLHGFIDPMGGWHPMTEGDRHQPMMYDFIDEHPDSFKSYTKHGSTTGVDYEELMELGFVGVGHAGMAWVTGNLDYINNPDVRTKPAIKTLRKVIRGNPGWSNLEQFRYVGSKTGSREKEVHINMQKFLKYGTLVVPAYALE